MIAAVAGMMALLSEGDHWYQARVWHISWLVAGLAIGIASRPWSTRRRLQPAPDPVSHLRPPQRVRLPGHDLLAVRLCIPTLIYSAAGPRGCCTAVRWRSPDGRLHRWRRLLHQAPLHDLKIDEQEAARSRRMWWSSRTKYWSPSSAASCSSWRWSSARSTP